MTQSVWLLPPAGPGRTTARGRNGWFKARRITIMGGMNMDGRSFVLEVNGSRPGGSAPIILYLDRGEVGEVATMLQKALGLWDELQEIKNGAREILMESERAEYLDTEAVLEYLNRVIGQGEQERQEGEDGEGE